MIGIAEFGTTSPTLIDFVSAQAKSPQNQIRVANGCTACAAQAIETAELIVWLDGQPLLDGETVDISEIAEAYLQYGDAYLSRLDEGFVIAVFDKRRPSLSLAVDRMGVRCVYWSLVGRSLMFSTSSRALASRPGSMRTVNEQALYDFFFFHMVPGPESVFEGVARIPPSSVLKFDGTSPVTSRYWCPDFRSRRTYDKDSLKEDLHIALAAAVERRYSGPSTGAFLSGGLDSSSVTGYLSLVAKHPKTFSMGFGVPEYDELRFARATNNHFECQGHEYVVTPEALVDAIPVVAAAYDEPFGNSSAIPTFLCAQFARDCGISRLLAGDGGDEIFAGNERYARHQLFEHARRLPEPIRLSITALVRRLVNEDSRIAPFRKLRSYLEQAAIPLPERFETWNFVYREQSKPIFTSDFLSQVSKSGPVEKMERVYNSISADDLLDRMLAYDWQFTLADNDLRKVTVMCETAGINVAYPMLDLDLVELSLRVPSSLKMRRSELRTFYKWSMRGFLPDVVVDKPKHGFGLPFGVWLKSSTRLSELVYDSLNDLKKRKIISASFIDQIVKDHRVGHAGYYGSVIWDLLMLEQWYLYHIDLR